MGIEMKVYHPLEDKIRDKSFYMWCEQGKPDGEQIVDYGLGKKKLCEYHWLVASMLSQMEADVAMRRMGKATTTLDKGYIFYDEQVGLFARSDEECECDFEKGILTKYGKKLMALDEEPCEEVVMDGIPIPSVIDGDWERCSIPSTLDTSIPNTISVKPVECPDYIEIKLTKEYDPPSEDCKPIVPNVYTMKTPDISKIPAGDSEDSAELDKIVGMISRGELVARDVLFIDQIDKMTNGIIDRFDFEIPNKREALEECRNACCDRVYNFSKRQNTHYRPFNYFTTTILGILRQIYKTKPRKLKATWSKDVEASIRPYAEESEETKELRQILNEELIKDLNRSE
jgi:hypothetical protein